MSVMRSTPSAAIPAIAATATVKSALAAAAAASSFGTSSSEMSSSVSFGKGATMRSERVKGADEGESDPGWDSGRLASHAGGVSAASNIIRLGDSFVAHPPPRKTDTNGRDEACDDLLEWESSGPREHPLVCSPANF